RRHDDAHSVQRRLVRDDVRLLLARAADPHQRCADEDGEAPAENGGRFLWRDHGGACGARYHREDLADAGRNSVAHTVHGRHAAPPPNGFSNASVRPPQAFYGDAGAGGEFFLKYEDVRTSASPHDALMQFLQSTYEAGATLAKWDRKELER